MAVARAQLRHGEDVHQARVIASRRDDLANAVFLSVAFRLIDVLDLHACLGSEVIDVGANGLPERIREQRP